MIEEFRCSKFFYTIKTNLEKKLGSKNKNHENDEMTKQKNDENSSLSTFRQKILEVEPMMFLKKTNKKNEFE